MVIKLKSDFKKKALQIMTLRLLDKMLSLALARESSVQFSVNSKLFI